MNLVAPLARPLFAWNTKGVLMEAGQGLARHLQVPLVKAEFSAPPWPAARPVRWAVLGAALVWLLARTRRSIRQHG
jgi:hypothetical protein